MAAWILVVDDEAASRDSLADVLGDEGYKTATAASGAEAIAKLEANDFDLVIADILMPEIDGVSLLKQIRRLRPQTLVMLMTAYASVETAVAALRGDGQDRAPTQEPKVGVADPAVAERSGNPLQPGRSRRPK